ncbi:unnamed protein product [Urochloa humidicola]
MLPRSFRVGKRRRFLNISTGRCIYVRIPDLRHYCFFGPTAEGLLVLCQKGTHVVQLLNPLTGQVTHLPCATTLLDPEDYGWRSTATGIRNLRFRWAGLSSPTTPRLRFSLSLKHQPSLSPVTKAGHGSVLTTGS